MGLSGLTSFPKDWRLTKCLFSDKMEGMNRTVKGGNFIMNRKRSGWIAAIAFILFLSGYAFAATGLPGPTVALYDSSGSSVDVSGTLYNGITYVPVRNFSEAVFSAMVSYERDNRTVSLETEHTRVIIGLDDGYIEANGRCFYTAGQLVNHDGTVYLPVRTLVSLFGAGVDWLGESNSAVIRNVVQPLPSGDSYYDDESLYWLSRIIQAESGGEPFLGKIAVASVILNRVNSAEFPSTVKQVIFDDRYGVQFTPTANQTIYNEPSKESIAAAKVSLEGCFVDRDVLYFCNPITASNSWIIDHRPFAFQIANHAFFD